MTKMCLALQPGQKIRLKRLNELAKAEHYKKIPEQEMEEMMECLEEKRRLERKGKRSRSLAHLRDVQTTTNRMTTEVGLTFVGERLVC